jgi:hypothetical protein
MLTRVNSFNSWSRLSNHKYYIWKYHEAQFQTNQKLKKKNWMIKLGKKITHTSGSRIKNNNN